MLNLACIAIVGPALTASAQSGAAEIAGRGGERQQLAAAPDHFFNAGEQRIRYRDVGRGEPVVLLHGRGGTLDVWQFLADSLASSFRVIAIDQRGHGQSGKPVSPAEYGPAMAHDVVALLDHLRIPRAHVVGFSLGAVVAAYVTVNFSDRVQTVSLLAGPFYADSAAAAQATASFAADMESGVGWQNLLRQRGLSDSAAAAQNARMLATSTPSALAAMTRAMANLMIAPQRASAVRVPALVAVGTADELLDNSRRLASWWPGARLVEVAGIGHGGIVRQAAVLSAVRDILRTAQ